MTYQHPVIVPVLSPLNFLSDVLLSLEEDFYQVSESDGYFEVCVTLSNHTERDVLASVFAIPGTASGKC